MMDPTVMRQSSSSHGAIRAVRAAMRLFALVIFVGILVLFVMMPTNTYMKKWLVQVVETTDSTYFGQQGATMLIYTFPLLFASVLGCVYVHLGKKLNTNKSESSQIEDRMAVLNRPVIVKGPLGIVTVIEMLFLVMFIALLVWSFCTHLRTGFQGIEDKAAMKGEKVWVAKLGTAATRLALTGNIGLVFLFFPVARGSSILPLVGLTSEGSIKYHKWLGHICLTLFTAHGLCFFIRWIAKNRFWMQILKWDKTGVSILAGEIALLSGLVMWVTTLPRIRRKKFELFYYTHHLYMIFMLFFIFHVGMTYAFIALPGFYLFLVDRYLRFLQSQRKVRLIAARLLPCETVELNFSKTPGLQYSPMSIMFVNLPSVSKLQWHPFTVTSNSDLEQDKLSVMIKGDGSWSKKLYQMLSSSSVDRLEASIEGPYGPVSTNFLGHDTLVMVSGGSGITPFISIIRELIFSSSVLKIKTPKILLISSFKSSSDLTMLDLILPISGGPLDLSGLQLQVEAYVTREKEPATADVKPLQALWFQPKATDAPASAILGPNSWLWLGAVISSSFIIFLVLMGLLTRYYIYPIDHNTGDDYPTSAQAVFNVLLICISIAIAASGAVLWNKKQNTMEARQVQNMEGSPAYGSASSLYSADKELESLPRQSLIQSTKVHYGQRPDLKRMLFECEGKNVGVLASGPKKMRHEVATICSSGLADNLHFESMSFSW